jgi:hypothetical protein
MWSRSTPLCLVGSLVFVYCFVDPCSFFLFRPLCGLSAFNVLLQSTSLVSSNSSSYTHPRRVSHIEQELRTLPEHLSSPTGFSGIRVACSIFFFVYYWSFLLFRPLFCLSLNLRLLITPLPSSNFSSYTHDGYHKWSRNCLPFRNTQVHQLVLVGFVLHARSLDFFCILFCSFSLSVFAVCPPIYKF